MDIIYSKALLRGHETIILITIQVLTGGHDIHSICKPPYLKIILKFYFLLHHHYWPMTIPHTHLDILHLKKNLCSYLSVNLYKIFIADSSSKPLNINKWPLLLSVSPHYDYWLTSSPCWVAERNMYIFLFSLFIFIYLA